ncbi:DTW domain-containing protein [Actinidia rufa]|uniref:tRNA-uridine aminocarboxypropyltransferase n=1 Tax=Actinidia rufa TaxID=165716 RepID=A0A7J0HFV4_9ERIC|nr:DTW domain-containing protein [Actinidia rufa]
MVSEPSSKRPTCPSCSKPSRLCLCTRIKTPSLNNSVAVTILQHSLEQNHPLNSTRIAALGLRNLSVVAISDVNFEARFEIRALESDSDLGFSGFESNCTGSCGKPQSTDGFCFTIRKCGVISSFMGHIVTENPNFDLLLASSDDLSNGFVVKKRSVGVEAIDFEVKNLIVLDGTWAKAKRVYSENPWLKLLPHVKLDLGKMSLYGEVRNQPRAGCLSTIESIVYALKAVGDETDGLENLLEVFESMVGDQRRCKDERLSKIAIG